MTDIIIKGKFTIDGLAGFDNVRFPLQHLHLKVFPMQPYMIESFSSCEESEKEVKMENKTMKPEVIRYRHISNLMEKKYLEAMGKKLFGDEFQGFVKEITFMHSEGFMTRKITPIAGTPIREYKELMKEILD